MDYTVVDLKDKIEALHPEIRRQGLSLALIFDAATQRYSLKLGQGQYEVGAYLEKQDADDCMAGKKCLNLAGGTDPAARGLGGVGQAAAAGLKPPAAPAGQLGWRLPPSCDKITCYIKF